MHILPVFLSKHLSKHRRNRFWLPRHAASWTVRRVTPFFSAKSALSFLPIAPGQFTYPPVISDVLRRWDVSPHGIADRRLGKRGHRRFGFERLECSARLSCNWPASGTSIPCCCRTVFCSPCVPLIILRQVSLSLCHNQRAVPHIAKRNNIKHVFSVTIFVL